VELLNGLVGLIAIILAFRKWRKRKNPLDLFVIAVITFAVISVFYETAKFFLLWQDPTTQVQLRVGKLPFSWFMRISIVVMYLWFVIYMLEWKYLYSLPFISGIYFLLYGFHTGKELALYIYLGLVIFASIWLLYNSFKNYNGISFGLFLVAIFYALSYFFANIDILYYFFRYLMPLALILGMNGWYEDKFLYNREERKKIQNTWIARVTTTS
jgi:hypothetical protein